MITRSLSLSISRRLCLDYRAYVLSKRRLSTGGNDFDSRDETRYANRSARAIILLIEARSSLRPRLLVLFVRLHRVLQSLYLLYNDFCRITLFFFFFFCFLYTSYIHRINIMYTHVDLITVSFRLCVGFSKDRSNARTQFRYAMQIVRE